MHIERFLYYQVHIFHLAFVFRARSYYIDARGVDARMTEYVGEFCYVFFYAVKCAREKMAQVMRKDFARCDVRLRTKGFHLFPYAVAADRLSATCYKDRAAGDILLLHITKELFL